MTLGNLPPTPGSFLRKAIAAPCRKRAVSAVSLAVIPRLLLRLDMRAPSCVRRESWEDAGSKSGIDVGGQFFIVRTASVDDLGRSNQPPRVLRSVIVFRAQDVERQRALPQGAAKGGLINRPHAKR